MSNEYYVYIHYKKDDGLPFYVGKGKGSRATSRKNRNIYWKNIVNKHDYFVEIIFDNLSEEESFQCEIDVIKELKYFCVKLSNLTDGGDGLRNPSEETRKKISEGNKGKKLSESHKKALHAKCKMKKSEEHKRNISIGQTGVKRSKIFCDKMSMLNKGKKLSEETRKKMSDARKGVPKSEDHKNKIRIAHVNRINALKGIS